MEKPCYSRQQAPYQEERAIEDEILMFQEKETWTPESKAKLRNQCVIGSKETAMKDIGKLS